MKDISQGKGGLCMIGSIHSDQRCPNCGSRFVDNRINGLVCPHHPDIRASRFRVYFKSVSRRFKSYEEAFRFLTGLRYETDRGTYDHRDYKRDLPLSFRVLATEWLELKRSQLKKASFKNIRSHMEKAIEFYQDKNIKEFKKRDFQLFIYSLEHLSSKSKHNYLSSLHSFFMDLYENEDLDQMPRFPKLGFTLNRRKTVDKETQTEILAKIYDLSRDKKIWFGIKMMATYINCRPSEIRSIKEKHIDLRQRRILIPHPKEREPKYILLLDEDIEIIKSFPVSIDKNCFFGSSGICVLYDA